MKTYIILGILISLLACNPNNATQSTTTAQAEKEITGILQQMYTADREHPTSLDDTLIFSKEIVALNEQCEAVTQADRERIAKSDMPTDKPLIREGSMVSSLYEGVTDFEIHAIKTEGKRTVVLLMVSNKYYKEQEPWKETIIFIDENGLKVDNILFDRTISNAAAAQPNLKDNLVQFAKQMIGQ